MSLKNLFISEIPNYLTITSDNWNGIVLSGITGAGVQQLINTDDNIEFSNPTGMVIANLNPSLKLDELTIGATGSSYTLPISRGTTGQVLSTNGSGNCSWVNGGGSSSGVSSLTNTDGRLDLSGSTGNIDINIAQNTMLTNKTYYYNFDVGQNLIDFFATIPVFSNVELSIGNEGDGITPLVINNSMSINGSQSASLYYVSASGSGISQTCIAYPVVIGADANLVSFSNISFNSETGIAVDCRLNSAVFNNCCFMNYTTIYTSFNCVFNNCYFDSQAVINDYNSTFYNNCTFFGNVIINNPSGVYINCSSFTNPNIVPVDLINGSLTLLQEGQCIERTDKLQIGLTGNNTSYVLPTSRGTTGQVLSTDNSGNCSWNTLNYLTGITSGNSNILTSNIGGTGTATLNTNLSGLTSINSVSLTTNNLHIGSNYTLATNAPTSSFQFQTSSGGTGTTERWSSIINTDSTLTIGSTGNDITINSASSNANTILYNPSSTTGALQNAINNLKSLQSSTEMPVLLNIGYGLDTSGAVSFYASDLTIQGNSKPYSPAGVALETGSCISGSFTQTSGNNIIYNNLSFNTLNLSSVDYQPNYLENISFFNVGSTGGTIFPSLTIIGNSPYIIENSQLPNTLTIGTTGNAYTGRIQLNNCDMLNCITLNQLTINSFSLILNNCTNINTLVFQDGFNCTILPTPIESQILPVTFNNGIDNYLVSCNFVKSGNIVHISFDFPDATTNGVANGGLYAPTITNVGNQNVFKSSPVLSKYTPLKNQTIITSYGGQFSSISTTPTLDSQIVYTIFIDTTGYLYLVPNGSDWTYPNGYMMSVGNNLNVGNTSSCESLAVTGSYSLV